MSSVSRIPVVHKAVSVSSVLSGPNPYIPPALSPVVGSAISARTRVVRWRPISSKSGNANATSRLILCGSAGEIKNELTVRSVDTTEQPPASAASAGADAKRNAAASNGNGSTANSKERVSGSALCTATHDGDVNDARFISDTEFVTAASTGSVHLYSLSDSSASASSSSAAAMADEKQSAKSSAAASAAAAASNKTLPLSLTLTHSWKRVHASSPVTAIDYNPTHKSIVTAGEDGAVHFLSHETKLETDSIPAAHSGSIYCVRWNSPRTLLTCGMGGRLSMFDTRAPAAAAAAATTTTTASTATTSAASQKPSVVCEYAGASALTCMAVHPSRPDTIATGTAEGVLCLWDIRNVSTPTVTLQAHSSIIWDCLFLPALPTSLVRFRAIALRLSSANRLIVACVCQLTCSEDGSVCLFDFNRSRAHPTSVQYSGGQAATIQPIIVHRSADGLPLNRFDVDSRAPHPHTIVCTTDSTTLLHFQHAFLRDA